MMTKNIFTRNQIKFSLKNATEEFSLIRLRMTINGVRFSYCLPVDYKIKTSYWDRESGKAFETGKQHKDLKGNPTLVVSLQNINMEIEKTASTLVRIIESYKSRDISPTASILQEELRKSLKGKQEEAKPIVKDLLSYIDYYTDLCKQGRILNADGTRLTPATLATYKSTRNVLKKYATARNKILTLDDITHEFRNDFLNFMYDSKHNTGEYKLNTIGKYIKVLKLIMGHAIDNRITTNTSISKKSFTAPREDVNTVYLNDKELDALYALELPANQAEVRDCFLISCYTGLRFSDLLKLNKDHINFEENTITIDTHKTHNRVIIPIHTRVKEIFDKYNNKPPKPQSNQAFNRMLKKLCEQAGTTEQKTHTETIGGKRIEQTFRKCDKVTTHTGRRSFATNAFKAGVPTLSIMYFTGHKTESSFMKYIRLGEEENAQILQNHEFFK